MQLTEYCLWDQNIYVVGINGLGKHATKINCMLKWELC